MKTISLEIWLVKTKYDMLNKHMSKWRRLVSLEGKAAEGYHLVEQYSVAPDIGHRGKHSVR